MSDQRPLVLDVDGTFLRTDMLFECFWAGLGKDPLGVLRTTLTHFGNRQVLKQKLAEYAELRVDLLPVNQAVKDYARAAQDEGREVVLASASDKSLVEPLAKEHGLSERVFASTPEVNLKGDKKAAALVAAYGEGGFDYAGNEHVDRKVWDHAHTAVVVGDVAADVKAMKSAGKEVVELPGDWQAKDLFRAIRPHQWVKNVLLFVPLIAAHAFDLMSWVWVLLGMAAFSAAASSIYLINDLLDLEADRLHKTKHKRPFASGTVPIKIGMLAFVVLSAFALGIAAFLGPAFVLTILLYMLLSLAYSLRFKRLRWIDIAVLASLYTLRVIAGAHAVDVHVSGFLLAFIFPTFLSLGCVKRLTEVTLATNDERLPGRGYGRLDRGDLLNVAILCALGAIFVFVLYSFSPQGIALYKTQWLMWLASIPLMFWMIRMVRLGYSGKQDYDPIVFAMRDKFGLGLLMLMLSIM
ncbi:MAG: UbiA family prenyltransferase, partial [Pseudomonadota bacterium]